jgi:hypothetical protein
MRDEHPGGPKTYESHGCGSGTLLHSHHSPKIKNPKKLQNSRNKGFSYYLCLMIEGTGSLTNGSGSGRPKNIWILRIRIRNTDYRTLQEQIDGKGPESNSVVEP